MPKHIGAKMLVAGGVSALLVPLDSVLNFYFWFDAPFHLICALGQRW